MTFVKGQVQIEKWFSKLAINYLPYDASQPPERMLGQARNIL